MTLPWSWVEERLAAAHNYWLATVGADGKPYVRPVWCIWHEGALFFTASPTSRKVRSLAARPDVSVHLELAREVVVVEGACAEAEPDAGAVAAYTAKYDWQPPPGQRWYRVDPARIDAADEATYPESATTYRPEDR